MSFSVNNSNSNNPFAYLQSLWQQGSSTNGTQSQSDPLSALLAALAAQIRFRCWCPAIGYWRPTAGWEDSQAG